MYKVNYTLAYSDQDTLTQLANQVVKTYKFVVSNVGTNYSCLFEEDTYNTAINLQSYITSLKDYFYMLFYDTKVQTFIYTRPHGCIRCYDPYLIEFIRRNKILSGTTNYIAVEQQLYMPITFGVDYDKTIFGSIEEKSIDRPYNKFLGNLLEIDERQQLSLLYAYCNTYYYMEYAKTYNHLYLINIFGQENNDILNKIRNGTETNSVLFNIMIKYFNDDSVTESDLTSLKKIDYYDNCELYYGIPIAIYCLEQTLNSMVTTSS